MPIRKFKKTRPAGNRCASPPLPPPFPLHCALKMQSPRDEAEGAALLLCLRSKLPYGKEAAISGMRPDPAAAVAQW